MKRILRSVFWVSVSLASAALVLTLAFWLSMGGPSQLTAVFCQAESPPSGATSPAGETLVRDEHGKITDITGWNNLRFGMTPDEVSEALGRKVELERWPSQWVSEHNEGLMERQFGWRAYVEDYNNGGIFMKIELHFFLITRSLESVELSFPYHPSRGDLTDSIRSALESRYGKTTAREPYDNDSTTMLKQKCHCDTTDLPISTWRFSLTEIEYDPAQAQDCDRKLCPNPKAQKLTINIKYSTTIDLGLKKLRPSL